MSAERPTSPPTQASDTQASAPAPAEERKAHGGEADRKAYYGEGIQPWDLIKAQGLGEAILALRAATPLP